MILLLNDFEIVVCRSQVEANQLGGVSVDELCIVRDDQPTTPFNYTYTGPMSIGAPNWGPPIPVVPILKTTKFVD